MLVHACHCRISTHCWLPSHTTGSATPNTATRPWAHDFCTPSQSATAFHLRATHPMRANAHAPYCMCVCINQQALPHHPRTRPNTAGPRCQRGGGARPQARPCCQRAGERPGARGAAGRHAGAAHEAPAAAGAHAARYGTTVLQCVQVVGDLVVIVRRTGCRLRRRKVCVVPRGVVGAADREACSLPG